MYSNGKNSRLASPKSSQPQKYQPGSELEMTPSRALIDIQFWCPLIPANFLPEKIDYFGRWGANQASRSA